MAKSFFTSASSENTSYLPFIKYDARSGRIFRVGKDTDGAADNIDITKTFKAVMDIDNYEQGFIEFGSGGTPPRYAVAHNMLPAPPKPADGKFKNCFRVRLRLSKSCGDDVREFSSSAASVVKSFIRLIEDFISNEGANSGKLPVVQMSDTVPIISNIKQADGSTMKTTNYEPVFEIVGWVPRPADLVAVEIKETTLAAAPAAKQQTSTGSTRAAPPATKQVVDEDDFG